MSPKPMIGTLREVIDEMRAEAKLMDMPSFKLTEWAARLTNVYLSIKEQKRA